MLFTLAGAEHCAGNNPQLLPNGAIYSICLSRSNRAAAVHECLKMARGTPTGSVGLNRWRLLSGPPPPIPYR